MQTRHRLCSLALLVGVSACAAPDGNSTAELAASRTAAGSDPATAQSAAPGDSAARRAARTDSVIVSAADRARIMGDSTQSLFVVIVSDFQCPYCKVWHDQTYPALKREFVDRGQVRLAYLNLPLPQHQHAKITAEMALCAGAQGRFWEFHDALFDSQEKWSALPAGTTYFDSLITVAKVNAQPFRACMSAHTMGPLVEADYQRAMEARVRSTPTFFIGNDARLEGAATIDAFRESIAKARGATGTGSR
jgi:protein-disulfide isomerase